MIINNPEQLIRPDNYTLSRDFFFIKLWYGYIYIFMLHILYFMYYISQKLVICMLPFIYLSIYTNHQLKNLSVEKEHGWEKKTKYCESFLKEIFFFSFSWIFKLYNFKFLSKLNNMFVIICPSKFHIYLYLGLYVLIFLLKKTYLYKNINMSFFICLDQKSIVKCRCIHSLIIFM